MIRPGASSTSKPDNSGTLSEPLLEPPQGRSHHDHHHSKPTVVRNRSINNGRDKATTSPSPVNQNCGSSSPSTTNNDDNNNRRRRRSRSTDGTIRHSSSFPFATTSSINSWGQGWRWVLFGVMIGVSTTSMLQQAISIPSLCTSWPPVGEVLSTPGDATLRGIQPPTEPIRMSLETTTSTWEETNSKIQPRLDQNHNSNNSNNINSSSNDNNKISNDISSSNDISDSNNISKVNVTDNVTIKQKKKNTLPPTPSIVNFENLPPPPELGVNDTFAACLLIKDDNHWLIEWLAYHYFVMPLRHLVIAIDPTSKTSPEKILKRWSKPNLMKIKIWKDKDYMAAKIVPKPGMFDNNTQLLKHRVRQMSFFRTCNAYLRRNGREWLMLVDTDEYIVPSYASKHFHNLTKQVSFMEPGSAMRLLKYYEKVTGDEQTCVYMPRYFFGGQESQDQLVKSHVPKTIDALGMVTQRFLFREPSKNKFGKNLVNLHRVLSLKSFKNIHHVSKEACPDPELMRSLDLSKHALMRVHHYLGTKEQYFFRDDPRMFNASFGRKGKVSSYIPRDVKRFNEYTQKATNEDHAAKAWIRGFVKTMGVELATSLLSGVGKVGIEE